MSKHILSPLPGTFYSKPAPDQPPFKAVGDTVAVGEVIGLIEVMKSFNEVTADQAGTIAALRSAEGTVKAESRRVWNDASATPASLVTAAISSSRCSTTGLIDAADCWLTR